MKKIISLLLVFMFMLSSCGKKESISDSVRGVTDKFTSITSYKSSCRLEIYDNEKTISWSIDTLYLSPNYYKVSFLNDTSNQGEILVKNDEGVYALTPSLGKEFCFESEWPNNSSVAYIPSLVIQDIINDPSMSVREDGGNAIVKSSITHKIHEDYSYQEVSIKLKSKSIDTVSYYNSDNLLLVKASYSSIIYDVNAVKDDFDIDKIMNEASLGLGEGNVMETQGSLNVGYVYNDAPVLEQTDSITIYGGNNPYTIVVSDISADEVMGVSRIYSDYDISSLGMVYYNSNSATLIYMDKEVKIISNTLSKPSMLKILNSISII